MDSYDLGRFPPLWREWNGKYRDTMRDFWRSHPVGIGEFATRFAGSSDLYGTVGRRPTASVNLITVHDGFTLRDLVSYDDKHNEANGENNRDGTSDNNSWNCGAEGPTADPGILALRARQSRAMLTTLMLSFGVPMLLGGDEMGRTQQGNNNAYCQDNEITWFDWASADTALLDFTKNLIAFRRAHPVFRRRRFLAGAEATQLQWFTPAGTPMDGGDWADPNARAIAIYLDGSDDPDRAEDGTPLVDDDFLVLVNSWWEPLGFALPDTRPQARSGRPRSTATTWRPRRRCGMTSASPGTPSRPGLARWWCCDQDIQAEREDPGGEQQLHPGRYPGADQQDQRAGQAGQDEPPGHDRGAARDVHGGEREHRRHPHRVDVQQAPGEVAAQRQRVRAGARTDDEAAMVAPATAAATNSMPTNSRPLPRNTVANRRSSRSPIRSRSTPMNHRKAIPANGMRFRATATAVRRRGSASQAPAIPGRAGTETRSSTSAVIRSTPKMIPAIAAPWDVRSGPPGRSHPRRVTPSIIRCGRVAADPRPVAS